MKKQNMVLDFCLRNTHWLLLITAVNLLSGYTRAVGSSYIQKIVDSLSDFVTAPKAFWTLVLVGCVIMLSAYLFRFLSATGARYMTEKIALETRIALVRHLKSSSFFAFEQHKTGDLQAALRGDVEEAAELLYNLFSRIMNNVFLFLFSVLYMMSISVPITLILVGVILLTAVVNQLILFRLKRHFKATRDTLGALGAQVENAYTCMDTIKTAGAKAYILKLFCAGRETLNTHTYKAEAIDAGRLSLYNFINNLTLFGSVVVLGYSGLSGGITIGGAVAYIYVIKQLLVPVEVIFRWMGRIVASNAAWERIYALLRLPTEPEKLQATTPKRVSTATVESLSFRYPDGKQVLCDLSLSLSREHLLGLSGESGCGKTTLIKILCGLYQSPSARFLADGQKCESFSGLTAVAAGEKQLFRLSIYENIALGDPGVSREDCMALLDRLGFGAWVRSLPKGLDTVVSSAELSGGQRQTISNVRALLGQFPIVILDEPFGALDSEKEQLLTAELERQKKSRLLAITSHRPGTLQGCDSVMTVGMAQCANTK